nr:MAG TPA: hypothetical protein [Bacteriophage sp.]
MVYDVRKSFIVCLCLRLMIFICSYIGLRSIGICSTIIG